METVCLWAPSPLVWSKEFLPGFSQRVLDSVPWDRPGEAGDQLSCQCRLAREHMKGWGIGALWSLHSFLAPGSQPQSRKEGERASLCVLYRSQLP